MTENFQHYEALDKEREWHLVIAASLGIIGGVTWAGYSGEMGRILTLVLFAGGLYYLYLATLGFARKRREFFKDLDSPRSVHVSMADMTTSGSGFIEGLQNRSVILICAVVAVLLAVALFSFF